MEEEPTGCVGQSIVPGFRFHPTDAELIGFYLRRMAEGKGLPENFILTLDLYRYDPWELPAMCNICDEEWFFFVPRDSKYPNQGRPNRITKSGYWKATGTDRSVHGSFECDHLVGLKKILVFYEGRAPTGRKTNWIMNEYRLSHDPASSGSETTRTNFKNDVTLCRIHRKVARTGCLGTRKGKKETFEHCSRLEDHPPSVTIRPDEVLHLNGLVGNLMTTTTSSSSTSPEVRARDTEYVLLQQPELQTLSSATFNPGDAEGEPGANETAMQSLITAGTQAVNVASDQISGNWEATENLNWRRPIEAGAEAKPEENSGSKRCLHRPTELELEKKKQVYMGEIVGPNGNISPVEVVDTSPEERLKAEIAAWSVCNTVSFTY